MAHEVRRGSVADVGSLEPLWIGMVEHHRDVAGDEWPVRTAAAAWALRREEYRAWLSDGSGTLFLAAGQGDAQPDGYAMLRVHAPGATWDLGEEIGELESLAVADAVRGGGVGRMLVAACREELRRRSITFWTVAVVEANHGAVRLYEREGFRPYYRDMLGRVDLGAHRPAEPGASPGRTRT